MRQVALSRYEVSTAGMIWPDTKKTSEKHRIGRDFVSNFPDNGKLHGISCFSDAR
jgi:hypothetical protein